MVAERQGWTQPGYKLVWSIVQGLDLPWSRLAHQGEKLYRQAFDLIHRREVSCPNEIWQADHTQFDIWLLDE